MTKAEIGRLHLSEFIDRITVNTDECIVWPYSKASGYGKMIVQGKEQGVHRLAYELMHGSIPDGLHVCHHCDNRACFNPKHLFAGTNNDNRQDQKRKGRSHRGTQIVQSKLAEADVLAIRSLYQKNVKGFGQEALAQRFGVNRIAIRKIVRRETWGWL